VQAFPPGSVMVLPGNTSHFHYAKSGEYITQLTAIGLLCRSRRRSAQARFGVIITRAEYFLPRISLKPRVQACLWRLPQPVPD
jgi:hypothetical protein